jgi:hypothetical protein
VLETLLEANLRKPLQLFCCILYDVSSITKALPSMVISVERTGKNGLEPDQESMGDA